MATMTIHPDEAPMARLRVSAALHGRSMEDACSILRAALAVDADAGTGATPIRCRAD